MLISKILVAGVALIAGLSSWVTEVEHRADVPAPVPEARELEPLVLRGADADKRRIEILRRAAVRVDSTDDTWSGGAVSSCYYQDNSPSGTTPKFDCVAPNGDVVKVKYGRNPEIHGEAAATRLLQTLGYPADTVSIVPRLHCYGCPRFPFAGAYVLANPLTRRLLVRYDGYTEFEWVSVERRFPGRPIETETLKGWNWWELEHQADQSAGERRAELDAFKLLAIFLAHWDNKSENQRLVCLDTAPGEDCARPLALIQDLGATFGPMKINLARWRELPVWDDRDRCTVSMRALPYHGASFKDTSITEAGRALFADRLATLTDSDVRSLFAYARFPEHQSGTDDGKDLDAWTAAFRSRVDQIVNTRCPA